MTNAITSTGVVNTGAIRKAVSAVNALQTFYDDFGESFLDAAKWGYGVVSSGSVTVSNSSPAVAGIPGGCTIATGATSGGSAWLEGKVASFLNLYGNAINTSFVRKTCIEFDIQGSGAAANIANATSFFGISNAVTGADTRASTDTMGFGWSSDVLQAFTDKGGTETTQALTDTITIVGDTLHSYRIELDRVNGARFFVDNVLEATITTNIPNLYRGVPAVYIRNDTTEIVSLALGKVRIWMEDVA